MDTGRICAAVAASTLLAACGGEMPVMVTGIVTDASNQSAAVGALVEAEGTGEVATTDADGRYVMELEPGQVVWLRATGTDTIPVRRPLRVPETGAEFALDILPAQFPALVYGALSIPSQDAANGIVAIHFLSRSPEGGEGATIDRTFGDTFSFDAMGAPTLTPRLTPGFYDGLIFTNVEPGETTSSAEPGTDCALVNLAVAQGEVRAGELTRIDFDCAP